MAPKAVGKGTISFGLVSIPVKLYSASNPGGAISFRLLSKKGHRLKQQYIDPQDDDVVVPRDQMVKGYEFSKDQYVIFTEEEIRALQETASELIEITAFVPEDRVPKSYYQKSYYLGPNKGGDRSYRLLSEAMKATNRVALAKYAARGKQYLVMVAPMEEGLVLHQLHYSAELVPFSEVPLGDTAVKESELGLAVKLIEQIALDRFEPETYQDDVKKRVEDAIQHKIDGHKVTIAPAGAPRAQIIDLMDALKASLNSSEVRGEPKAAPSRKTKKGKRLSK